MHLTDYYSYFLNGAINVPAINQAKSSCEYIGPERQGNTDLPQDVSQIIPCPVAFAVPSATP